MNEEDVKFLHWTKHWKTYKKFFKEDIPDFGMEETRAKAYMLAQQKERKEWLEWRKNLGFPEKYGD